MKRIPAYLGLVALTAAMAACTGGPNSANLVPQTQAHQAADYGGSGQPASSVRAPADMGGTGQPN